MPCHETSLDTHHGVYGTTPPTSDSAAVCATMLPPPTTGRPSRYCSPACRQRAYRLRSGPPRNLTAAQPYWATDRAALYLGDAGTVLHGLPDESLHCIVASPPFFNLRDSAGSGGQHDLPIHACGVTAGVADGDLTHADQRVGQAPQHQFLQISDPLVVRCLARREDSLP
jgi:hypothetical protein